ncbi:MAG: ribosome silencing factor [Rhodospirillaceae bacterium TMED8]|nr:ribosome silencing factor [Magnetovibrio sp.]OUT49286.1 MAG: ribosome silencing factor [Rhodospirillaceae bacterium TMED8]|tara:strand:- start:309 stop:725 length:417 start_codon:yes stop_codon:yes gene_type:complete
MVSKRSAAIPNTENASSIEHLLNAVEIILEDDKAEQTVVIELAGKTEIADHLIIASGTSHRHVGAMADHLYRKLKGLGVKNISVEGNDQCDWVLIDGGDIIIHLFRPEVRQFYNLEKIWSGPADEGSDRGGNTAGGTA